MQTTRLERQRDAVRRALTPGVALNLQGAAAHLDAPRHLARYVLEHLIDCGEVRRLRRGQRALYVWRTPEIRDCDCDGTCLAQIAVLHDARARGLWALLPEGDCIYTSQLVQMAQRLYGWSDRTTHKRLMDLVEVGLAAQVDVVGEDQRLRWYTQREPHPTAASWLEALTKPFA